MDSGHMVLAAITPETIASRVSAHHRPYLKEMVDEKGQIE
jgi:regulator of extracellular matrix RemA (YlzA/DUF370 family)